MVFEHLARFGRSRKGRNEEIRPMRRPIRKIDVLKDVPGMQTREDVENIFMSLIRNRSSVRSYKPKNVSENHIKEIIETGACAPSAGNQQPWEFIVVRDRGMKAHIVEACYGQEWMLEAPVFIVACVNTRISSAIFQERGEKLYGIQSVAASIENMLLAAEALGLAACWVGAFNERSVAILLKCPEYVRPNAIITIGYSNEPAEKPRRHDISNIIHLEEFGETYDYKRIKKEKSPL